MKFILNESQYDRDEGIDYRDVGLSETDIIEKYLNTLSREKVNKWWVDEAFPNIRDKNYLDIISEYNSPSEYVKELDLDEIAEDLYEYGFFNDLDVEDLFYNYCDDEIYEYKQAGREFDDYVDYVRRIR